MFRSCFGKLAVILVLDFFLFFLPSSSSNFTHMKGVFSEIVQLFFFNGHPSGSTHCPQGFSSFSMSTVIILRILTCISGGYQFRKYSIVQLLYAPFQKKSIHKVTLTITSKTTDTKTAPISRKTMPCMEGMSQCFQYFAIKCCFCVKGWTYDSSTVTNLFKNLAGSPSNQSKPSQQMLNRTCSWVSVRHLESHLADTFLIPSSVVCSKCKDHLGVTLWDAKSSGYVPDSHWSAITSSQFVALVSWFMAAAGFSVQASSCTLFLPLLNSADYCLIVV